MSHPGGPRPPRRVARPGPRRRAAIATASIERAEHLEAEIAKLVEAAQLGAAAPSTDPAHFDALTQIDRAARRKFETAQLAVETIAREARRYPKAQEFRRAISRTEAAIARMGTLIASLPEIPQLPTLDAPKD